MLLPKVRLPSFFGCVVFYCENVPQFFIRSSTDGLLGFSQIVAIVNNVTMNIGMHIFFTGSLLSMKEKASSLVISFRILTEPGVEFRR